MTKHEAISAADDTKPSGVEHHEAIIVGSGMTGLYQLHKLLETGFDVISLERNADVGGLVDFRGPGHVTLVGALVRIEGGVNVWPEADTEIKGEL